MRVGILGGGLSGLSLAGALQQHDCVTSVRVLEMDSAVGGLCRSYPFAGIHYDVGPHILFSRDQKVLDLMVGMLGDNVHKLRRSNKVLHDGRFIKYPFENDLASLSPGNRNWCLNSFLDNPHADRPQESLLDFFLATFGEGITNLYLRPYNEKIWKFDPSLMDTQMVGRVPRPPDEDIIRSARGEVTEGYTHQLHFFYPRHGGIQSLITAILWDLNEKVEVSLKAKVAEVDRSNGEWRVTTSNGTTTSFDRLVSTIPIPDLLRALGPSVPQDVQLASQQLKANSIAICVLQVRHNRLGDNFAVMVPDPNIIFHRLSRLDFLTPDPSPDGTTRLLAEVTYRDWDEAKQANAAELIGRVADDLTHLGLLDGPSDVLASEVLRQRYAYVIYDRDHRSSMERIRNYCEEQLGIVLHGRFGEFAYVNMDEAIKRSLQRCESLVAGGAA